MPQICKLDSTEILLWCVAIRLTMSNAWITKFPLCTYIHIVPQEFATLHTHTRKCAKMAEMWSSFGALSPWLAAWAGHRPGGLVGRSVLTLCFKFSWAATLCIFRGLLRACLLGLSCTNDFPQIFLKRCRFCLYLLNIYHLTYTFSHAHTEAHTSTNDDDFFYYYNYWFSTLAKMIEGLCAQIYYFGSEIIGGMRPHDVLFFFERKSILKKKTVSTRSHPTS